MGHAILERVLLFGTDQRITSGPAAKAAASPRRQSSTRKQAEYMAAPERFAKRQILLAPRAPSIHGPSLQLLQRNVVSAFGGRPDLRGVAARSLSETNIREIVTVPVYELIALQYSSASMMVMTRLVTDGSDGSGECTVSVES